MKKILVVVGIILLFAILGCFVVFSKKGFGLGKGSGQGTQTSVSDTVKQEESSQSIIVKVKESNIYINDEQCESIDALKERISEIDSKNKQATYKFEQEYAIKATYDEVKETLSNLEEVLGIHIEYNE